MRNSENEQFDTEFGRIVRVCTAVEMDLRELVHSQINDFQQIARVITAELPFSKMTELLLSLYRERFGEDQHFESLKSLVNRAISAQQKRNLLVHSEWWSAGAPSVVTRTKSTAKLKHGYKVCAENWNLEKFEGLVSEFIEIRRDIGEMYKVLIANSRGFDNPVFPPER